MVKKGLIAYAISVILLIASFIIPPTGVVDDSVLVASSIIIGGYQLLFGTSLKSIKLNKEGLEIEYKEDKE